MNETAPILTLEEAATAEANEALVVASLGILVVRTGHPITVLNAGIERMPDGQLQAEFGEGDECLEWVFQQRIRHYGGEIPVDRGTIPDGVLAPLSRAQILARCLALIVLETGGRLRLEAEELHLFYSEVAPVAALQLDQTDPNGVRLALAPINPEPARRLN